ncbi:MAG: hypothetical protein AAF823_15435 [Planctomycetota bacterium]
MGGWLGAIIVLLAVFGPIIANVLKEAGKANDRRKASESSDGDGRTSRERLDDLAARRRAELSGRAQAGLGTGGGAPAGGDPGNLTMAERIARARAKAQYERRSADLSRAAGGAGRTSDDPIVLDDGDDARVAELERRRAAELDRRRVAEREAAARREADARRAAAERRRAAEAQRQREAADRASQQRQRQGQSQRSSSRSSSGSGSGSGSGAGSSSGRRRGAGIGKIDGDAISRGEVGTGKGASRLENAIGDGRSKSRRGGRGGEAKLLGVRLTRRTMRHAVLLREVLDKPVSMRENPPGSVHGLERG